ncbi:MAG: hypothetical protein P8I51_02505 [Polaribacter sp.]|jgi:hypothetical protein|nr:hypothetical protein [Polaribacter sp.]MDG1953748.1 hypothetical protein [Polaribacter sp.]
MKNLKKIIAVIALGLLTVLPASANTNSEPNTKAKKVLRTEIVSLLGTHSYDFSTKVVEAQVSVILNNKSELIVISVNSNNEEVTNYVKSKLNYKKVTVKGIKKGTVYRIPLKMIQSS